MKKKKRLRVYVDVGSHGMPFMFEQGRVAELYPKLLHVYKEKITSNLKPAILELTIKNEQ